MLIIENNIFIFFFKIWHDLFIQIYYIKIFYIKL